MNNRDEILYKLWLSIVCRHDPEFVNKCIKKYGSAEEVYYTKPSYKDLASGMRISRVLRAERSLEGAKELLRYCDENEIKVIPIGDERYPKRLAEVYAPPQILYVRGSLPDIDNLICVSVVGSRECSDYSREFANELSYNLTKSGIIVISGMANGIDSAAHTGALSAGGITLAVLAGGVDVVYPKGNFELYKRITERGAVISERPPKTIGRASFYRERNRIIAGLSNGVAVVEGGLKSGTRLTAGWAVEENRDLFAVPGKPSDKGAELPNKLIKENAKLITSAEDIVSEYISVYSKELKNGIELLGEPQLKIRKEQKFDSFDGTQRKILEYLNNCGGEAHIDEISRECKIPASELGGVVIQLLMMRAIEENSGEYYSINRN